MHTVIVFGLQHIYLIVIDLSVLLSHGRETGQRGRRDHKSANILSDAETRDDGSAGGAAGQQSGVHCSEFHARCTSTANTGQGQRSSRKVRSKNKY